MLFGSLVVEITVTEDEIMVVAQAITDAHAHKAGMDPSGRMDDAKTVIAAVDALMAHRVTSGGTNDQEGSPTTKVRRSK